MNGASISEMTYHIASPADSVWSVTFEVYLTEVDTTTISSFQEPGTKVFTGALDGTGSTMSVPFDNSYKYNGEDLLVTFYGTTTGRYTGCVFYGTTASGASIMGYSSTSLENVSANQRNFLPKTTFTYEGATVSSAIDGLTYTGEPQTLCQEINENADVYYKLSTDTEWSTELPTAAGAGDYTVQWYVAESTNYKASGSAEAPNSFTATIAKADAATKALVDEFLAQLQAEGEEDAKTQVNVTAGKHETTTEADYPMTSELENRVVTVDTEYDFDGYVIDAPITLKKYDTSFCILCRQHDRRQERIGSSKIMGKLPAEQTVSAAEFVSLNLQSNAHREHISYVEFRQ